MAFLQTQFFSKALGVCVSVNVLLPEMDALFSSDDKLPVLYLLHGLTDDHSGWMRYSSIERYAREYRMAVVMPAVNRSFYTDLPNETLYETFVAEELPRVMERVFPLRNDRAGRYVAGLSMGGYGAMKLALKHPDRYCAAASFSGVLDIHERMCREQEGSRRAGEFTYIFGSPEKLDVSDDNLFVLGDRLLERPQDVPALYVACGTEDFLFDDNERFIARYGKAFGIHYETEAGGHEWRLWDKHIERALAFFPGLPRAAQQS